MKKIKHSHLTLQIIFCGEEYHQDFYKKEPLRYKIYEKASGRENLLKILRVSTNEKIIYSIIKPIR